MVKLGSNREASLGDFLAQARRASELTLVEVAQRLGLKSPQSVWDWENGKGSGIPADMLLRLVKLYRISESEAYEQLLQFHRSRAERKAHDKFEEARARFKKTGKP